MAKQKKNSNYQTEKSLAKKVEKEELKKKQHQAKVVKIVAICAGAVLALAALVVGILFAVGVFEYSPEPTYHATLNIEGHDAIHIELYGEDAPKTVKHFIELAEAGYFDGKYLHTLTDGLLYGGSELADGGVKGIEGEFANNGIENKIPMTKGTVCLSRGLSKNSGYGQFFILTNKNTSLAGDYAAFGKITDIDALNDILKSIKVDKNGNVLDETAPKILSVSLHEAHH